MKNAKRSGEMNTIKRYCRIFMAFMQRIKFGFFNETAKKIPFKQKLKFLFMEYYEI